MATANLAEDSRDPGVGVCVKEVAHVGRHKYRPFRFTGSTTGSLN